MRLALMNWPAVEAYLQDGSGIIIPIGSTEQHGPTGLIGTDALTAEAMADRVGETLSVPVAPVIPVGMAHHHMSFPGSMTLRPSTLIALVRDWVDSLSSHGFKRFLFINGHGGNIPSVQAAFYEIYEENRRRDGGEAPDVQCRLCSWFLTPPVARLTKEYYGDSEGQHATPSELAVTWALHPDLTDQRELEPRIGPMGRFTDSRNFRATFPDGRMGSDPSLATPEAGQAFLDQTAAHIAQDHRAFLTE
ncbi:MAG: creatininase family protein [Rhodospirillaceae bacterium]